MRIPLFQHHLCFLNFHGTATLLYRREVRGEINSLFLLRRISALSAILSGVAFTSDCYDLLSENERTLLNLGLELHMTGLFPQKWDYRKWDIIFTGTLNGRRALAVINDTQEEMEVDFSEFGFHSALSELLHPRGLCSGTVRIPPHDLFKNLKSGNNAV